MIMCKSFVKNVPRANKKASYSYYSFQIKIMFLLLIHNQHQPNIQPHPIHPFLENLNDLGFSLHG